MLDRVQVDYRDLSCAVNIERVVVFTGDLSAFSVRKGIGELFRRFPNVRWLIVDLHSPRRWTRVVRNQMRHFRREGLRWIPHIAATVVRAFTDALTLNRKSTADAPGNEYELQSLLKRQNATYVKVGDIHATSTLATVHLFRPDLGISLAAPILRPELFEIPRFGTINLHKGKLPDYRGMPPAFWELWNSETEVGCSIHRIEKELDAGPVLLSRAIPIEQFSTLRGLQIMLDEVGVELTCEAVARIADGSVLSTRQTAPGRTNRKPSLAQRAALEKRYSGRRSPLSWGEAAKEAVFFFYVTCARPLPRLLLGLAGRQRISIIVYHRVCDSMRDSVTVGVAQFERQMIDLKRHAKVVGIEDVVRLRASRRSLRPIVAVTFDDGYRDNFEQAAPILLRHGVTAAFYVCTELIESDRGFPHDLENLGQAIPAMNWEQVKELSRLGFVIGSHSETHVNATKADPEIVEREIVESKRTLQARLGLGDLIFAYPYGGRADFNDHWRDCVRRAGYIGCLSAYGGSNRRAIDSWNILRSGISHAHGKWSFRARLEGWS